MKYPQDYTTNEEKYKFVCKAKEQARELYNKFSKWANAGITQAEYDSLPERIKAAFPLAEKLSKDDWQKFFSRFKQLSNEIAEELSTQRAKVERDCSALPTDIDLGEISDAF